VVINAMKLRMKRIITILGLFAILASWAFLASWTFLAVYGLVRLAERFNWLQSF